MAFDISSLAATHVENVGTQHAYDIYTGIVTLSGTTKDVSIPGAKKIVAAFVTAQNDATATYISATSGSTFTITGGSNKVIMWLALVQK